MALAVAVAVYVLLFHSSRGLRLRAVGHNPDACRAAGMHVERSIVQALALSGACSGVAGAVLVFGSESHRLIAEGGAAAFTQSAGFNGIVAALFGGLHPLWSIPASFLFGGLLTALGLFVFGGLYPRKLDAVYSPRFSAEEFGIVVECRPRDVGEIDDFLRDMGAKEVNLVEG